MEFEYIFLVDKPSGWTSFDVVAKIRGLLQSAYRVKTGERKRIKVGHIGTLDPIATGLLVVLTGKNTKKVPELMKLDKTYEVEMTLGSTSSTGDSEGKITVLCDQQPSLETVTEAIMGFVGESMQTPPVYSAIKIGGKRAYQLAREGKEVELEPRKVHIYAISGLRYEYPKVLFRVDVSSGTYIRSLVEDIGTKLGTGAYMSGLRRTRIGDFTIENAQKINDLEEQLKR